MIARDRKRLEDIEQEVAGAFALPCNITDTPEFICALDAAVERAGAPNVVVHNAVGGTFGGFRAVDPSEMERNFAINVMALLHLGRWAAPLMVEKGGGSIIVTGNTSALRGKADFAAFAPTKAAQRILAESMARDLGPDGIHVAYLVIDAIIDLEWTRQRFAGKPDDFFVRPDDIASEIWHLAHQPRSAWSFLSEIRPFSENW